MKIFSLRMTMTIIALAVSIMFLLLVHTEKAHSAEDYNCITTIQTSTTTIYKSIDSTLELKQEGEEICIEYKEEIK